jgi:hypothetical protein
MKKNLTLRVLLLLQLLITGITVFGVPNVTITSPAVPAANVKQGSTINVLYIAQVSVTTDPVTISNVNVTLSGSHDANDLGFLRVYFNATAPTIAGATLVNYLTANFTAPHTYSIGSLNRTITAGSSGYFIIAIDVESSATDNNTIKINGATNPLVFTYSAAPNLTNNQTDAAGVQTIQAADVTITSVAVPAADVTQGSETNLLYIAQMSVSAQPVTVNDVQINLSGTHDANDLGFLRVYYNATSPTIAGATLVNYLTANFAAPHTYSIGSLNRTIAAGATGYFIIAFDVNSTATDNNTIKINGATNPLTFGFNTAPNITNSQSDVGGLKTIEAADVTVTSQAVPAADVTQGSEVNVLYIAQMSVSEQSVTVNNVQINLSGTHDANDLGFLRVYYNASSPTIAGATLVNYLTANFAAPHTYSIGSLNRTIAAGATGYFILAFDVNSSGTDNNTIKINGGTNPLAFGFNTAPNIINNQTDVAGLKTIEAADVTITSQAVPASNVTQASEVNVLYITQMGVSEQSITVNSVDITLSGTHDADDLGFLRVYFNATAPTIAGATLVNYLTANFAGPHTYNIGSLNRTIAAGGTGYFIIAFDVKNTATHNNTIKINGATNPLAFNFNTAPNVSNNQTDAAGVQTIQAADVTIATTAVPAANVGQGTEINILYIAQMAVTTQSVTVSSVDITLSGTHDADDLGFLRVYYNATSPTITGATLVNYLTAYFTATHTYTIGSLNRTLTPGTTGYFILAVDVDNTATDNNTIKINGAANPLLFGFNTVPNLTNSQTDAGGLQTIQAADVVIASTAVPASAVARGTDVNVLYIAQLSVTTQPITVTDVQIALSGTHDADDLGFLRVYYNVTSPTISGATLVNYLTANFAATHTYSIGSLNRTIPAGSSGYFIIAIDVAAAGTINNTIKINGATNPLVFGYTTGPNLNNNQTDAAGVKTIVASLPVSLVLFTAKVENGKGLLQWKTASEINNAYFDVEHSSDGIIFTKIGRVAGHGTTSIEQNYQFVHETPVYGNNYYQLKQVDLDNRYRYSGVVQTSLTANSTFVTTVFPNPVKNTLRFTVVATDKNKISMQVVDITGKIMLQHQQTLMAGENKLQFNVDRLSVGIYYLQVKDRTKQLSTQKILVVK